MPDAPDDAPTLTRMVEAWYDQPPGSFILTDEEAEDMSRVLAVVREHIGQALAEAQTRITELAATPDLRAAALLFRNPEGFEPLAEALGIADDTEARGKLDAAFKAVARNAKEKPDGNA